MNTQIDTAVRPCRICGGRDVSHVVDLGNTPLADDFLTLSRLNEPEVYYPLRVVKCNFCLLVQLTYTVNREHLYPESYPYLSSTTETGREHYRKMAADIVSRFHTQGELAVDIGSNVGVLLVGFKEQGMDVLGVEPVAPIAARANLAGIPTLTRFFDSKLALEIAREGPYASVITGTNVVAHIDNLRDLAAGIEALLHPDGVFVFEAPYLVDLIHNMAYDTIYHEHLSYLSIAPIRLLFAQYGLQLFDVEYQPIHGGTMRYYIGHDSAHDITQRFFDAQTAEAEFYAGGALDRFADAVANHRQLMRVLLMEISIGGSRVAAVSAPAKGMTLINYCGIGSFLDYVSEKSDTKIGKYTPGAHIPVVPDDRLLEDMPDYALLLAWNFADEIMRNLHSYSARGGKFIIPMPTPHVISAGGVE